MVGCLSVCHRIFKKTQTNCIFPFNPQVDREHSIVSRTEGHSSIGQKENVDVPQVFRGRVLVSTGADHEGAPFLHNHGANGYCHQQQHHQQQRQIIETNTTTIKSDSPQPVLSPPTCIFQNPLYISEMPEQNV